MSNLSTLDEETVLNSPFAFVKVFGGISSFSGSPFLKAGITYYYGKTYHDLETDVSDEISIYDENITNMSLISIDLIMGLNLFRIGDFSPFIAAGAQYLMFTKYKSELTEEIFLKDLNTVYTNLTEDNEKPASFPGVMIELGTDYNLTSKVYLRFGASYHYSLGDGSTINRGLGLSASYIYKIF